MEIESQRLDFLTLTIHITKAQNVLEHIREGRKKKKKKPKEPRPSHATWAARDTWVACDLNRARCLGRAQPRSLATQALRAAQVARRLGRALPGQRVTQAARSQEIGRASCRERVCLSV